MDRTTLQQLADTRLRGTDALLASGQWYAAYYLLGYCVECALTYLEKLLEISGLKSDLEIRSKADSKLEVNWNLVKG